MGNFTPSEIDEIDRLWRELPADHMWTGWAASGREPQQVWIFRTRAHWRRFPLSKTGLGYSIADERGRPVVHARSLKALLKKVELIPGLEALSQD
ncbi:hypothetical protein [Hyphomonas pacifica]|uniref:Uncharacterized protein n=1 Tax=Hyphomonas pacifica TaxID=1280941 RepID=A0A062U4E2_9PROT|nr:hypothetical protein [Hyphomonas pacifica]KCZ51504.1 hypothetical protein HY2_11470 [Hyphomonas pacifica]RAN35524.1 hypothetical protein HY3_08260 [Hyphomonas pacifica]RAN36820.1 hypothetical protein HY11_11295 [Hyphomonas pacifica]